MVKDLAREIRTNRDNATCAPIMDSLQYHIIGCRAYKDSSTGTPDGLCASFPTMAARVMMPSVTPQLSHAAHVPPNDIPNGMHEDQDKRTRLKIYNTIEDFTLLPP